VTGATRPASQREVEQGTLAHSKMLCNWGTIYARSLCSVAVIAFAPLSSIDPREMLALLTDPRVLRHLPLAGPERRTPPLGFLSWSPPLLQATGKRRGLVLSLRFSPHLFGWVRLPPAG
jgi:hypothetical protein